MACRTNRTEEDWKAIKKEYKTTDTNIKALSIKKGGSYVHFRYKLKNITRLPKADRIINSEYIALNKIARDELSLIEKSRIRTITAGREVKKSKDKAIKKGLEFIDNNKYLARESIMKSNNEYMDSLDRGGDNMNVIDIEINYEIVENMASFGSTLSEIVTVLELEPHQVVDNKDLMRAYAMGIEGFKLSLRKVQFELSKTNSQMAVFLGKQYLGQSDKLEISSNENVNGLNELSIEQLLEVRKELE